MVSNTSYISLGISPNAEGIVMQPVVDAGYQRPFFAFIVAFADLDSRGRPGAIDLMGTMLLRGMKAYFPVIHTFADALIPDRAKPLTVQLPDHSGSKRELHLRIHAIDEDRSVVIRRFKADDPFGIDMPPLMLEPLMAIGPEAVADVVGARLLAELAALHPDVFAPFPALSG